MDAKLPGCAARSEPPWPLDIGTRRAAELKQLKPERLKPGDHAVYGGLVREATRQQRVLTLGPSVQGRERAQHLRSEMAANADLVDVLPVALLTGHWSPF